MRSNSGAPWPVRTLVCFRRLMSKTKHLTCPIARSLHIAGANFPLDLETPPKAHAVRLAFQSVLLALLLEMAQPTLLDAKAIMGSM